MTATASAAEVPSFQRPRHARPAGMPNWLHQSYLLYIWGEAPQTPAYPNFDEEWDEAGPAGQLYIEKAAELDFKDRTKSIEQAYNKIGTGFTMLAFLFSGALGMLFFVNGVALWLCVAAIGALGISLGFFAWALISRFSIWTEEQIDPLERQMKVSSGKAWVLYLREWLWHRDHVVRPVRKLQMIGLLLAIMSVLVLVVAVVAAALTR